MDFLLKPLPPRGSLRLSQSDQRTALRFLRAAGSSGGSDHGCENVSECGPKKTLKNPKTRELVRFAKSRKSFGNGET